MDIRWHLLLGCGLASFTAGCLHPKPDMRDFSVVDVPSIAHDISSSAILSASATTPHPSVPEDTETKPELRKLEIPRDIPGGGTPPFQLPKLEGLTPEQRAKVIREHFPMLPALNPEPLAVGNALSLVELEQLAMANNPKVKQAAAEVEAARGRMIQAGLLPNPEIGFQADQINSGTGVQTRGQPGGYVGWEWITAGKLSLARLAEGMAYANAQVALRRTQIDVTVEIRRKYFAVLLARQSVQISRALTVFSDEIYNVQLELLRAGELAGYEPLQSYVLAVEARGKLAQARNRYAAAWRELAAVTGIPDLPQTELAGTIEAPVPEYNLDSLREMMLAQHTDIQIAHNSILEARYRLKLTEVTPIPDLKAQVYIERDWSTPPYNTQVGVQVGGAIPVFNRNQGNRLSARSELARAIQQVNTVQNDLLSRLAAAWEVYASNRILVDYYRSHILPNQVRVYRGTFERSRKDPQTTSYIDIVVAQQMLATALSSYLNALGSQWEAVVDLTALTQQAELYPSQPPNQPGTSLEQLLAPPHPVEISTPTNN